MKVKSLSVLSFLLLFLYELAGFNTIGFSTDNLFVLLYLSITGATLLYSKKVYRSEIDGLSRKLLMVLILLFVVSYLRGILNASGYFDYKLILTNIYGGGAVLSLAFIMIGLSVTGFFAVIRFILKHILGVSILLILLNLFIEQIFTRMMVSVFVLMLMITYLQSRQKKIALLVGAASFFTGLNWRANTLRLLFSFGSVFFNRKYIILYRFRKGILVSLFLLPLIGLYYSITTESIFEKNAFSNNLLSDDYKVDTRTFLYSEVFQDLLNTNSLMFGKGLLGTYNSLFFDFENGRHQVEVGFLKYMLQVGLVGFSIISFLLFRAAWLGLKRSNNRLSRQLGIFLGFHFVFLFIEGIPAFSQYYFFVWAIIGLLITSRFRSLTDKEISDLINNK